MMILNQFRQKSRKVKASTLIESLVASVIIITVFAVVSLTLNNIFNTTMKKDTQAIQTELNKLLYLYQHHKIDKDYQNTYKNWEIEFALQTESNITFVVAEAILINKATGEKGANRTVKKRIIYETAE